MSLRSLLATGCVMACVGVSAAAGYDLSGKVVQLDGSAKAGVTVTLLGSGLVDTTDASGAWELNSSMSGKLPSSGFKAISGNLFADGSRLRISLLGVDPSGRRLPAMTEIARKQGGTTRAAAPRQASAADTLAFSFGGKVFLRDTISASRSGIVRQYDTTWNTTAVYGWFTDTRDTQAYRTVAIGSQTWMAQNLNHKVDSSWCYEGKADNCARFGRLYQWSSMMDLAPSYNSAPWNGSLPRQGICPTGWHVPSDSDWTVLAASIGNRRGIEDSLRFDPVDGLELESATGWTFRNGQDLHGFRALPAGYYSVPASPGEVERVFSALGGGTTFWSATEVDRWYSYRRAMSNGSGYLISYWGGGPKIEGYSLRCVQTK